MINQASLKLIEDFEGLSLTAYQSKIAEGVYDVPTIGYGHTTAAGPPKVQMGMRITKEEAEAILAADLQAVERQVDSLVRVPLNGNQRGCLVSFTYNLGVGNFSKSTLLKRLNTGDYDVGDEFLKWVKAQGVTLPGLVRRRQAEKLLWETPDGMTPVTPTPVVPKPTPRPQPSTSIWDIIVDFIYMLIGKVK